MNATNNPITLEIHRTSDEYRVLHDGVELGDGELLDVLSNDEVTIVFVCSDPSVSITVAQAEQGALVYWEGLARAFDPIAEEVSLFVFITTMSSTATRTPKVKVRAPIIKPAPVFVLG